MIRSISISRPTTADTCLLFYMTTGALGLPREELRALIAHSLGHLHLDHATTTGRRVSTRMGGGFSTTGAQARLYTAEEETAADRYAAGQPFASPEQTAADFDQMLRSAGIIQICSRPRHPQTCGRLERSHQTTKTWLARRSAAPARWGRRQDGPRGSLVSGHDGREEAVRLNVGQSLGQSEGSRKHHDAQVDGTGVVRVIEFDGFERSLFCL